MSQKIDIDKILQFFQTDAHIYEKLRLQMELRSLINHATSETFAEELHHAKNIQENLSVEEIFDTMIGIADTALLEAFFLLYPEKHFLDLREPEKLKHFSLLAQPDSFYYCYFHPTFQTSLKALETTFLALCKGVNNNDNTLKIEFISQYVNKHYENFDDGIVSEGFLIHLQSFKKNWVNVALNQKVTQSDLIHFFIFNLQVQQTPEISLFLKEQALHDIEDLFQKREFHHQLNYDLPSKGIHKKTKI